MKRHLSILVLVLILALLIPTAYAQSETIRYAKGSKIQDFTFTTYQGEQLSLFDILEKKEAVLINIWATWCGPCRNEFPYLQEAYERYQDRVEVIALSCEQTDTPNKLADFAASYGLTFKIGQDPVDFLSALRMSGIPTSLLIDRYGTICFVESGAMPDSDSFMRLFDAFVGPDYTESVLLDGIPPKKPDIPYPSAEDLSTALETDESITFRGSYSTYTWPMQISRKDDRTVVASTNQRVNSSRAAVAATVTAEKSDALVVTFKLSSESLWDVFEIRVDGKLIKTFGGNEEWQTYAYEFPITGTYNLELVYTKNGWNSIGEDMLWIDQIALLSGQDAVAAIEANPDYPIHSKMSIHVQNDNARRILINDPTGTLATRYGDSDFYMIPDDVVNFTFQLTADRDPETSIVYFNYDDRTVALAECLNDGSYIASSGGDSIRTTGYCDSSVILYPDQYTLGKIVTYFKSEADIDAFLAALTTDSSGNILGTWMYADNADENNEAAAKLPGGPIDYTFICMDQNGEPVQGAMLQICNDDTCQVLISDNNGICAFTGDPYAWEIHILMSPDGYTADSADIFLAPVNGGEMTFTFHKSE